MFFLRLFLTFVLFAGTALHADDLQYTCGPAAPCTTNVSIVSKESTFLLNQKPSTKTLIKYFFSPQCPHCRELKRTLLPQLRKAYANQLEIQEFDIVANPAYLQELVALSKRYRNDTARIPSMLIENRFLVGTGEITLAQIQRILNLDQNPQLPIEEDDGVYDVSREKEAGQFPQLNLLMVAALLDGINPCAFATIIFFVTYLNFLKKDKRYIAQIGLAFVAGVFVCYFLLGLGIFHLILKLKAYDWFSFWFSKILGLVAFILGLLSLYDFYLYRKTGQSSDMVLQLPLRLKQIVHSLIRRGVSK